MSQVSEVKEANDIIAVIGEKLTLQRAGTYYKGPCPFHNEKTPSFFVSEQFQRFQCFGCGAGGDVFEFLMRYESISFYEALQNLAQRAGLTLRHELRTKEDEEREQLLGCLDLAKDYYHYLLTTHKVGQKARDYLKQRGVTAQSIKLFSLGYSLNKWDGLINYLHDKKKISFDILMKAGLIASKSSGRYYDRLRDRIIFPLRNHRGQVVGFSGRLLDPEAKEAKYINSPETTLYHKSKMLYGLSELRRQLVTADAVVVTEGEFDVISSAQADVNHVVAIKGSAFTADHAQLLKRLTSSVILALDADAAGVEATKRALQVLKPFELELKVVPMLQGKDPDDWARQDPKAWRQAVKHPITAYQFLIDSCLRSNDANTASGKKQIIKELAVVLWQIESSVERESYLKQLALSLQTTVALLTSDIRHFAEKGTKAQNETSGATQQSAIKTENSRLEQLEQYLAFLLLRSKPQLVREYLDVIQSFEFEWPVLKALVTKIRQAHLAKQTITSINQITNQLADDLQQELMKVFVDKNFMLVLETGKEDKEWRTTIDKIKLELQNKLRKNLAKQIAQLESKPELTDKERQRLEELMSQLAH